MSTTSHDTDPQAPAPPESDLDAAGAQLSTAPVEQAVPGSFGGMRKPGPLGYLAWLGREVTGWVRWMWRQLTSMRVALILLFLLSLGAVPGSLIPQQGTDELKVAEFRQNHDTLAQVYEKLGLFHVYSSVWFSAIYILLFVSLIGCIVPRTWQFVGQLRGRPPRAPRRLDRLPAYATWRTEASPEQARDWARGALRRRRFRTDTYAAESGGAVVTAEKGYLREAGNLVFHVALIVMLVAFASGSLLKYEGGKLIVEGDGFANTKTQYDDFKSGSLFTDDDLDRFSFTLDRFTGTYETSGPQRGTPRVYRADVTYQKGADGAERHKAIEPNHPLVVDGTKVFLNGHGYAPQFTVRDGKGKVVYRGAVPMLPQDGMGTATGVVKVADGYTNAKGKREQLGFEARFLPTIDRTTMTSSFPGLQYPVLALNAWHGDLGIDGGVPQNVYQLDTAKMKQFKTADGKIFAKQLMPGETMKLPNGAGSVTFEKDVKEWASFQISHQPGGGLALGGAIAAILGLAGSLFIQRRRVWARATRGADGVTVVEFAGLGRSESAKVPEELAALVDAVHAKAPGVAATERNEPASDAEVPGGELAPDAEVAGGEPAPDAETAPVPGQKNPKAPKSPKDPKAPKDPAPSPRTPADPAPSHASHSDETGTDSPADAEGAQK
ncbi:cytochrome c biogenesis protein ResB [Streptomyces sp. NRRL F-5630]|uniref:cytochrome c biogenesis protein ResB n=1 Tax=Streptomyces sp. NRRL F-5630 TaxID=1463864 RepID=UPI003D75B44D